MRSFCVLVIVQVVGCKPQAASQDTAATETGDDTATDTGTQTDTYVPIEFDCTAPLPAPPFQIDTYPIQTQEDFDFSTGGYLVYQYGMAIVGASKNGDSVVLSPGAAGDPRGVHGLSDGRIVIMSPWDGAIKIADPATNGLDVLAGGLNTPNGVEVDMDDRIYFTTYGEVGWTEPDGSDDQIIYNWGAGLGLAPNGIALSPDEQRLTVAVPEGDHTDFVTIDKLGPDEWGNVQVLQSVTGFYSTLDSDICGNIYTIHYSSGELWRIEVDGTMESLGVLEGAGMWGFSALRFGSGRGGWERDRLYVSKRNNQIYEIDVGVPGRRHPTS